MFAKLFETSQGQFLLVKSDHEEPDGTVHPAIEVKYHITSPVPGCDAVASRTPRFANEDDRDKTFDEFTQEDAQKLADEGF